MKTLIALTFATLATGLLAGCQMSATQGYNPSFQDRPHSRGRDD